MMGAEERAASRRYPSHPLETKCRPLASVVVATHNGLGVLRPCLESLGAMNYPEVEIILVDNASVDGTADYVARHFPFVRMIQLPANSGFAGGYNVGIAKAIGPYVFLINNDAEVDTDVLDVLVEFMEAHPGAGLVCPKVVKHDDPNRVDNLGLATFPDGITRGLRRGHPSGAFHDSFEILFPSGCAVLCRRQVLDEVGAFDEDFHLMLEDADLGWRARLAGWSCYCVPKAIVRHRYSSTIGAYSTLKAFYVERNRIWLVIKYFPLGELWKSPFYSAVRYAYQLMGIVRGRGASSRFYNSYGPRVLLWTVLRAYAAAVVGIPTMLKKRREVLKRKKVSNREIVGWLRQYKITADELTTIC